MVYSRVDPMHIVGGFLIDEVLVPTYLYLVYSRPIDPHCAIVELIGFTVRESAHTVVINVNISSYSSLKLVSGIMCPDALSVLFTGCTRQSKWAFL
ncbi:MAG: hypothetical protein LC808_10265 [Actinobacteria bacterium]|nr:hypothetical protein [Actinomycetota bacterium]